MYAFVSRLIYSDLINSQAFSESSGGKTVPGAAASPSASTKEHQHEVNLALCMVKSPTLKDTSPKLSSSSLTSIYDVTRICFMIKTRGSLI